MTKSPSFQFYPADFLSDGNIQLMTQEEIGIHILLMCYAWRESEDQCSLPNDDKKLAKFSRISEKKFKKIKKNIFLAWEVDEKKITQKRLKEQAELQKERREKLIENGKKGGRPKKEEKPKGFLEETKRFSKKNQKETLSSSTSSSTSYNPPNPPKGGDEEKVKFFKEFAKWLSSFEHIGNPHSYARQILSKYPLKISKKAFRDQICTSPAKFREMADHLLLHNP